MAQEVTQTMNKFCNLTEVDYDLFIQDLDKGFFASLSTALLHESGAQLKVADQTDDLDFDERNADAYGRVEQRKLTRKNNK
jgi:hypothetical protein